MASTALGDRLRAFASRPILTLSDDEPSPISDLPAEAVQAARLVWRRRVINETGSRIVAERLLAVAPDSDVEAAMRRLQCDEEAHARLAADFLRRLGGEPPSSVEAPPEPGGTVAERFASLVFGALVVGETVSAARYAMVRTHTDVPAARSAIELLLKDEVTHSDLGFLLAPLALERLAQASSIEQARARVARELGASFRYLDEAIGLDSERRGVPLLERPQPLQNLGVVEPMLDAVAFYRCVERRIVPSLMAIGVLAEQVWRERWGVAPGE